MKFCQNDLNILSAFCVIAYADGQKNHNLRQREEAKRLFVKIFEGKNKDEGQIVREFLNS